MSNAGTVLIIEDSLSLTNALKDTIEALTDHTADGVFNYREALDYIRQNGMPSAITTDIFLDDQTDIPSSDFWHALQALADEQEVNRSDIKIAVISGGNGLAQQALSIERSYGFPTIAIEKPLDQSEIVEFVNSSSMMQGLREKLLRQYEAASAFPSLTVENAIRGLQPRYPSPALSNTELVHGLKPEDILAVYSSYVQATPEQQSNSISFDAGVGHPISGQVVFDIASIEALKAKNPNVPIILIGRQHAERVLEQSPFIDGAVNFSSEPVAHFTEIARNKGVSVLTITPKKSEELGIVLNDQSLIFGATTIEEGDIITIDPNNNRLYLEEVPVTPAVKPENFDVFKDAVESIRCSLYFSPQVETADGSSSTDKDFDLSKMENYFQYKDGGVDTLNRYLFDPTDENLGRVKSFLKEYIRNEIVEASNTALSSPSFRLLDFKPDEFIKSAEDQDKLKELHGIDDLRGTALAIALPDLYRIQVEAILEEMPHTFQVEGDPFDIGGGEMDWFVDDLPRQPFIIIPMVEDVSHYRMMQSLVQSVTSKVWGNDHAHQVSTVPMVESLHGIEILTELLPTPRVLIGGSDLMSDVMGGVSRSNEDGIKKWMDNNPTSEHPFRSIPQEMRKALERLTKTVNTSNDRLLDEGNYGVKSADVYFCGVQAQYLSALETLSEIGIRNVTVPPNDYYLEGLPMALRVSLGSKEIVSDLEMLEQQNRMARRAEYS